MFIHDTFLCYPALAVLSYISCVAAALHQLRGDTSSYYLHAETKVPAEPWSCKSRLYTLRVRTHWFNSLSLSVSSRPSMAVGPEEHRAVHGDSRCSPSHAWICAQAPSLNRTSGCCPFLLQEPARIQALVLLTHGHLTMTWPWHMQQAMHTLPWALLLPRRLPRCRIPATRVTPTAAARRCCPAAAGAAGVAWHASASSGTHPAPAAATERLHAAASFA